MRDDSNAYIDFLSDEVSIHFSNSAIVGLLTSKQARKYACLSGDDEELEEDNLLDTPIDKLEPYTMFKQSLLGKDSSFIIDGCNLLT